MKTYYPLWRDVPVEEFKARWPNFSPQEIACKGTGSVLLDFDALDALQRLRTALGKPLLLTSAYRSLSHNQRVGGATNSQHLEGKAFDISVTNHDPAKLIQTAKEAGFTGFGHYPSSGFLHVDTGPARSWKGAGANDRWFPERGVTPGFPEHTPTPAKTKAEEIAPVAIPGVLGGVTSVVQAVGNGNGPVQWAVAVAILLALAGGVYWFFRLRDRGDREDA